MSYATLNDGQKSYFIQSPKFPNMYAAPDEHTYDTPYDETVNYETMPTVNGATQNGDAAVR